MFESDRGRMSPQFSVPPERGQTEYNLSTPEPFSEKRDGFWFIDYSGSRRQLIKSILHDINIYRTLTEEFKKEVE